MRRRAIAEDEAYWSQIQSAFDTDRTMINLNNGGCSPAPTHVLEQMIRDLHFINELPVENMWRTLEPRMESTRRDLAKDFGCDPEEMAVVRNASEANEIVIFGMDLKRGDEVISTNQNYPRMITSWQQRARRDGIVFKQISFKVPPPSDAYLVEQFRQAITPRTKVIEVTHITNLTGQIMPVRDIVRMARPLGHPGARRRRARVQPLPVQARRPRVRLLRHVAAQVDARADRLGVPLRAQGAGSREIWSLMGSDDSLKDEHPEVRADRHASAGELQRGEHGARVQPRRSDRTGRSRGCATCATAGRNGCSRRATA